MPETAPAKTALPVVEAVADPDSHPEPRPARAPKLPWFLAVALLVLGLVLGYLAVTGGGLPGLVRALLGAAGLIAVFSGLRRLMVLMELPAVDIAAWGSGLWLGLLSLAAILADVLPLGNANDPSQTIGTPGYATPDLFSAHPLGTNGFGLDLLARSVYGARVSLLTVALTVLVSLVIGGAIGMIAGYFRGKTDLTIGVVAEASLVVPPLILLIAIAAVLGPASSMTEAVVKNGTALAIVGIPAMIRLSRANTLVHAQRDFVTASRALGAKHSYVLWRDLLPNVALPLVSYGFIIAAVLIVAEGSLAFLGLGLQQPEPSWGNMIAEGGLTELRRYPHVPLIPGAFMFLTVFSLNILGERLRTRWDAREVQV